MLENRKAATLKQLPAPPVNGDMLCDYDSLSRDAGLLRLEWPVPSSHQRPGRSPGQSPGKSSRGDMERMFLIRWGDEVSAYYNICPHTLVPLDGAPYQLLSADREELQCAFHGARFRFRDGRCVAGPVRGKCLRPYPIRIVDGAILAVPAAG